MDANRRLSHGRGELSHEQGCVMVEDGPGAIEALMDLDPSLGIAAPMGEDLEDVWPEGDGVVVGDDARVFETEERLGDEVGGPGAIRELRPSGGASKARVVASEESREEGVRRVRGGDAGETQFGHEAILQRAEDPLDAALRLGTGGGDPADPQFLQEASHLSGCPRPLKLLVEAPAAIASAVEDAMAIGVGGEREARSEGELTEDVKVPDSRFLLLEPPGEDLPCGIIDRSVQHEFGPAVFEPGMVTAIELDEHPFLRHALAAGAMRGGTPSPGAGDAGLVQEATDGLTRDPHSFPLAEELGQVLMVHRGIGGAGQPHDALAEGIGQPTRRGTAAIAVGECGRSAEAVGTTQPSKVADRESQEARRLRHLEVSPIEGIQNEQTTLLT